MHKVSEPEQPTNLDAFIDESIHRSIEHGYHPSVFIGMRARHGTEGAISRLVRSGEIQSGFKRLKELGLIKWSIEAAVIRFPEKFSRDDLECAEFRIRLAELESVKNSDANRSS